MGDTITQFTVQSTGLEEGNVTVVAAEGREHVADLAADVRAGLTATPKRLSCRYFYDPVGSELFEEICRLPEYYLTRAEGAILEERAEEIADLFGGEIRMLPERRGNRMNGVLDATKAKDLGWRTQRGVEDYIASIVEDSA